MRLEASSLDSVSIEKISDIFAGEILEVIARMRDGTPAHVIPVIAEDLGISESSLFDLLHLSKSKTTGWTSTNVMLSAAAQDRIYRLLRVLRRATEVLEDNDSARQWISRPNRVLGGEAPITLLDTAVGYELVLATLTRIEYGVVS